jgi:hypothetical protein
MNEEQIEQYIPRIMDEFADLKQRRCHQTFCIIGV